MEIGNKFRFEDGEDEILIPAEINHYSWELNSIDSKNFNTIEEGNARRYYIPFDRSYKQRYRPSFLLTFE